MTIESNRDAHSRLHPIQLQHKVITSSGKCKFSGILKRGPSTFSSLRLGGPCSNRNPWHTRCSVPSLLFLSLSLTHIKITITTKSRTSERKKERHGTSKERTNGRSCPNESQVPGLLHLPPYLDMRFKVGYVDKLKIEGNLVPIMDLRGSNFRVEQQRLSRFDGTFYSRENPSKSENTASRLDLERVCSVWNRPENSGNK